MKQNYHPISPHLLSRIVNKVTTVLYPGDEISYPIHDSMKSSMLQLSARRATGLDISEIRKVKDNVSFKNETNELILLPKSNTIANCRRSDSRYADVEAKTDAVDSVLLNQARLLFRS